MEKKKQEMKMQKITLDDLFSTQEQRDNDNLEKVVDIDINLIDDFPNHPFKVIDNEEMQQMKESIEENLLVNLHLKILYHALLEIYLMMKQQ